MRKKFLGAFLLGVFAIATTSTFVSCKDKDYDDDIIALQNKDKAIDALIAEKVAACEAAIEGLKQADKDLDAAIKDGDAATLAAAKAAVATAQSTLEAALAAAQNKHDQDLAALDAKLSAAIAKAQGAAEAAQATADKNTTAIAKVASDLAAVEKSLDARLVAAEKQLGTLEAALKAQEAALEQEKKDRASGDAANLEKINKLISDIATLQKNLEQADKELKTAIENLDKEIDAEIKAINEKLAAAEDDAKKVANRVSAIETRLDVITGILSKSLRSLVFMPYVYVDGIEAITYPEITIEDYLTTVGYLGETFSRPVRIGETVDPQNAPTLKIPAGWDYRVSTVTPASPYYPEIGVDYHLNPSSAQVAWEDIKGFIQRDTRYTTTTRALTHQDDMDGLVVAAQTNAKSGYQHFKVQDGVLSVGLKVTSKEAFNKLWNDDQTDNNNYIAALQVKNADEENFITSDYALIYPEKLSDLKIVWGKENDRVVDDGTGTETTPTPWDMTHACPKDHQIFDNPKDALLASASIFVPYNQSVKLSDYIETCFHRVGAYGGSNEYSSWKFEDTKKYGFTYEFKLVPYEHTRNINNGGGANTGAVVEKDHEYAVIDAATGEISAKNQTKTTIGREPLVQVLLKYGNEVVEDAYILCRFTANVDAEADFEDYAAWQQLKYDNCNGLTFSTPVGKENDFRDLVMAAGGILNGEFDFLTFNGLYDLDGGTYTRDALGIPTTIVTNTIYKGHDFDPNNNDLCNGTTPAVYSYRDRGGNLVTNGGTFTLSVVPSTGTKTGYKFTVNLTAPLIEALTHDANSNVVTKDLYLRWTKKSKRAPLTHIYMKFTITITRDIEETGVKTKIDQYWYGLDGADAGWDVVAYNTLYPHDFASEPATSEATKGWTGLTDRSFEGKQFNFTTTSANVVNPKFYFVPQNSIVRVPSNNRDGSYTEWIITPAYGDQDAAWKTLYCEKDLSDNGHVWALTNDADATYRVNNKQLNATGDASATDLTAMNNLMHWCNIAYNAGAFENVYLYAVKKSDYHNCISPYTKLYTPIAKLDPTSGEVTPLRSGQTVTPPGTSLTLTAGNWDGNTLTSTSEPLDLLLNAIGYANAHANVSAQLHQWTGIIAENGCNVAVYAFTEGTEHKNFSIFSGSWERPINLVEQAPDEYEDAEINGKYIPVYDLLSFYDWRGPVLGSMENENKWLYRYYNINRITVDVDPTHVTTTMNGGTLGDRTNSTLAQKAGQVHLYLSTTNNPDRSGILASRVNTFALNLNAYKTAASNAQLLADLDPTGLNKMGEFGYIFYENNGLNVTEFKVRIPMVIYYEWGHFNTYVDVTIKRTQGN